MFESWFKIKPVYDIGRLLAHLLCELGDSTHFPAKFRGGDIVLEMGYRTMPSFQKTETSSTIAEFLFVLYFRIVASFWNRAPQRPKLCKEIMTFWLQPWQLEPVDDVSDSKERLPSNLRPTDILDLRCIASFRNQSVSKATVAENWGQNQ